MCIRDSNVASIPSWLKSKKWDGRRHDRWGTNDFLGLTAWCDKDVQLKAMTQFEALISFENCRFLSVYKHCQLWVLVSSTLCIISALHSCKADDLVFFCLFCFCILFLFFLAFFSLSLFLSLSLLCAPWFPVVSSPLTQKVYYVNILSRQINVMSEKWLLKDMKTPDAQ